MRIALIKFSKYYNNFYKNAHKQVPHPLAIATPSCPSYNKVDNNWWHKIIANIGLNTAEKTEITSPQISLIYHKSISQKMSVVCLETCEFMPQPQNSIESNKSTTLTREIANQPMDTAKSYYSESSSIKNLPANYSVQKQVTRYIILINGDNIAVLDKQNHLYDE